MAGYRKEEIVGQHLDVFRSGKTPASVYKKGWESLHAGNDWRGELSNRRKDGSDYWVRASVSGSRDLSGKISHFVGVYEDITQEYVMTEKLNHLATHDVLTNLINRYEFERRAERLLESSLNNDEMHALCYIDLDQFKIINDTCGHLAGDELLRQISTVLKEKVRVRDTLARLGGDEFGVLMEHCTLIQAERVADTLLEAVDEFEFVWEGRSFRIGMSIGLVEIDNTTLNLTELFKRADSACYMAKDLGRNRVHTYHLDDIDIAERSGQMQWATKIQQALENDSFTLFAQAIEPLNGGLEKHYELLVRMIGSEGKIIPPGAFLPAAERYNLISRIDRWVISTAFKLMFENPAFVEQIDFISINLSGESLADNKFNEFVTMLLETGMVSGDKICFEITETAAITNLNMANIFIDEMKAFGCRFALDDFGSGLSSFGYLKKLPVDYLKIDGMFVKDIIDDPIDLAMVKSINEVGHIMGMKTIAEFVENDEIKASLNIIRVDYGQGYGIHKPISFDELIASSNII